MRNITTTITLGKVFIAASLLLCTSFHSTSNCLAFTAPTDVTKRTILTSSTIHVHVQGRSRRQTPVTISSLTSKNDNNLLLINDNDDGIDIEESSWFSGYSTKNNKNRSRFVAIVLAACLSVIVGTCTTSTIVPNQMPLYNSWAVSGGGFDYAGTDISGQDFSNANYKGKDFTQVIAKATKFAGSNLQGCRFYKAYLVKANFAGADIRGASLEDTSMEDADLTGAIAVGAYFSASLKDAKSLKDVDFTDAQIPSKTLTAICNRDDVTGTNPQTGTDTRESLLCL